MGLAGCQFSFTLIPTLTNKLTLKPSIIYGYILTFNIYDGFDICFGRFINETCKNLNYMLKFIF